MSNIIIPNKERNYNKSCKDFVPLKDGTLLGDIRYCNRSLECKQTDAKGSGFISDWHKFYNYETQEQEFDYFCTGMYGDSDERREDKEIS